MNTPQQIRVKPSRPSLIVKRQNGQPLAPAGEIVPLNAYWSRRLTAGDVVMVPDVEQEPTKKPKKDTQQ